jgi:hypothetical protein
MRLAERSRRVPTANWFALIGTLNGRDDTAFVIGRQLEYTADASARLVCFANDVPWAYWNNFGSVTLTITRLERAASP